MYTLPLGGPMRLALMSLLMIPLTLGCGGDAKDEAEEAEAEEAEAEEAEAEEAEADTGADAGTDDTGTPPTPSPDREPCDEYADYICACDDEAVAAQCDDAMNYAEAASGDAEAQAQCAEQLASDQAEGVCEPSAVDADADADEPDPSVDGDGVVESKDCDGVLTAEAMVSSPRKTWMTPTPASGTGPR